MSIFSSMYIGMSGMRSNEGAIGVIGDNIANVNTVGFKASRAVFSDVFYQQMLGSAGFSQAGQGASIAAVQRLVSQGALLGTQVTTDLAVNGGGMFVVSPGGSDRNFYTRNGQFQFDTEGYLTTVGGLRLQGYTANAEGVIGATLGDINLRDVTAPPTATTEVTFDVTLPAEVPIPDGETAVPPFDPTNPEETSQHSTSVTVYDSLGVAHQVDVYFYETGDSNWGWSAFVAGSEVAGGAPDDDPVEFASGTLEFNEEGQLSAETQNQSSVNFGNGAASQDIAFDFGEPAEFVGDPNYSGSNMAGDTASTNFVDQDGFATGQLNFIDISPDGQITGTFSNGQERVLAQVALARFVAPGQLLAEGDNLFSETEASGDPAIGAAGTGGRGEIFNGTLEQSNVDLTNEFTQLIVAQRGFQAASRTITTADEMLIEVVNLKR